MRVLAFLAGLYQRAEQGLRLPVGVTPITKQAAVVRPVFRSAWGTSSSAEVM
jgi:hypothetical protein